MKSRDTWRPTKFIRNRNGHLVASRDPREVNVTSRLMVDFIATWYDSNLKEFAKGKLLDLGCGNAPLYGTYSPFVDSVTLADWGNSLHKNRHLDVECDITKKLPFKNNSFDTLILSDVLEHIPNPNYLMSEINRILKPNGKVLMNVPFFYWLHETPHDYYRYTEFMLQKMAEDQDMHIIKLEALAGGWAVLLDLVSKLLGGHPITVKAIQKFGPKILSKRLKTRLEFPLLYAIVLHKGNK